MQAATLDDFMAWNDELNALARAGVPIDVDLGRPGTDEAIALERINAAVARRVSQGASLADAVQGNEQVVTPAYGSLVQAGLRGGGLAEALANSSRVAVSIDDLSHSVRMALLYPLIVCGFAYVGLVSFCLFLFPTIDSLHRDLHLPVGSGLSILRTLRATLPYWIAIPPLLALLLFVWQCYAVRPNGLSRRRSAQLLRWLPGMSRAIREQQYANFADTVALLLDAGAPLNEALPLAAGATGVAVSPGAANAELPRTGEEETAPQLPPFLRYALGNTEGGIGRSEALRMAAEIYRAMARRRADQVRVVAPIVLCVVIGGGVTLLYGLALFVPVIELLRSLAR